jgi:hypothetical protein
MARAIGVGLKLGVLAIVATAGGWMIWKSMPPYSPADALSLPVAEAKTGAGPHIGNCEVLPSDNVWNMPVDKLHKDKQSDAYIHSIGDAAKLHPDFGSSILGGIPYANLAPNTPRVKITFEYHDESDLSNYPIPRDVNIEGGPSSDGDRHILLIDPQRCILYEIYSARPNPDGTWAAGSGEIYDMTSNALRQEGRGSADAAGLEILPGLVRYDEVAAGEINHALRFTIPHTQASYVWPARHKASRITDPNVAPMGIRMRLRPDYDISGFSKSNQVILTALKKYGMLLADNGGPMFFSGAPDKRWDDGDLHNLTKVTAADFEVVDESGWQMLEDSARVDPVAFAHP